MIASTPQFKRWSTENVPEQRRLDYWIGAICEAFLEMDCDPYHLCEFSGELLHHPFDVLGFNQVKSSAARVSRTCSALAKSQTQPYYLITEFNGPWQICQGGLSVHALAGDAVLVDAAHTYEFDFSNDVRNLSIQLPREWLNGWLPNLERPVPRVISGQKGWGRSLSALCKQIAQEPATLQTYPEKLLTDQIGAMLAACIEAPETRKIKSLRVDDSFLVKRALDLMRQNLGPSKLTATQVADKLAISSRTLHRSFTRSGLSFMQVYQELRMQNAAHLMSEKRFAHLDIAALGRRCGIDDASNFVRQFHAVYGLTPARWRKQRS